jgi:ribonucleotide monophosphatase NagD (HAD superfamily)
MRAALVRTGKLRQQDLEGIVNPDAVVKSLAELPAWWDRE